VIIPVHDEEVALPRLLTAMLAQELGDCRLQVVVVVNGSTDATATVALEYSDSFAADGHQLVVVEIANASKATALNEGDRHTSVFPRLYLDADIVLSPTAIRRTIEVLSSSSEPRLAAPQVKIAESAMATARRYGRLWVQLPYVRSHVPGVGFYAVNASGRARWWRFPTRVGADDKFVRLHFARDEAVVIKDASFTVYLPERFGELLRVRGRWNTLNRQIVRNCPGLDRLDRSRWASTAFFIATTTSSWPDIPAFIGVWFAGWGLSLLSRLSRSAESWSRADSSPMRMPVSRSSLGAPSSPCREAGMPTLPPMAAEASERTVHAVVVSFNSLATITQCVDRLLASIGLDQLRITIVDNASIDGSPDLIASTYPGIELIANSINIGFGAAVNQAVSGSTSRWIATINPDVEVRPDTISMSVEHLELNPDVGSCGVRAVHDDGGVHDGSFSMRPTGWSEITRAVGAHRLAPASRLFNPEQCIAHLPSNNPIGVDVVAGSFNVIDADLFRHLGGYDEHYFPCGQDVDLGVRAVEAGAAPEIVAARPILHRSNGSFASSADARVAYLRGRAQFEHRWWPHHRAAFGQTVRVAALLCRIGLLGACRSERRSEFAQIWARRAEWAARP
jgi:hypothetical protein